MFPLTNRAIGIGEKMMFQGIPANKMPVAMRAEGHGGDWLWNAPANGGANLPVQKWRSEEVQKYRSAAVKQSTRQCRSAEV